MNVKYADIAHRVWESIDDDKLLPLDTPVLIEHLSHGDDGIFPTEKSWRSFIFGNFAEYAEKGHHWLEGECKPGTVKKWCYPVKDYKDNFSVQVGPDEWQPVNGDDLKFEFTFNCNNYTRDRDFCAAVEMFVTASFKEKS